MLQQQQRWQQRICHQQKGRQQYGREPTTAGRLKQRGCHSKSDARHWKHQQQKKKTSATVGTAATAETPASRDPMGERAATG